MDKKAQFQSLMIQQELDRRQKAATSTANTLEKAAQGTWFGRLAGPQAYAAAAGLGEGALDTVDGLGQLFGSDKDRAKIKEETEYMKALRSDDKYGISASVGRGAGILLDPVAAMVPVAKATSAAKAFGIGAGVGAGFGYVAKEEEEGTRLRNAALGAAGGAVLGPAMYGAGKYFNAKRAAKAEAKAEDARVEYLTENNIVPDSGPPNLSDEAIEAAQRRLGLDSQLQGIRNNRLSRIERLRRAQEQAGESISRAMPDSPASQYNAAQRSARSQLDALADPNLSREDALRSLENLNESTRTIDDLYRTAEDMGPPKPGRVVDEIAQAQKNIDEATKALSDPNLSRLEVEEALAKIQGNTRRIEEYHKNNKWLATRPVDELMKLSKAKLGEVGEAAGIKFSARTTKAQRAEQINRVGSTLYSNPFANIEEMGGVFKWVDNWIDQNAGKYIRDAAKKNPDAALGSVLGYINAEAITGNEDPDYLSWDRLVGVAAGAAGAKGISKAIQAGYRSKHGKLVGDQKLENLKAMLIDRYGLPEEYTKLKRGMVHEINHVQAKFREVVDEIEKLGLEERKALYRMMTGQEALAKDYQTINKVARELITDLGQSLVDAGMLDADTFAKNAATYLNRSYWRHIQEGGMGKFGTGKLDTSELRRRGLPMTLKKGDPRIPQMLKSNEGWYIDKRGTKRLKDKKRVVLRRDWTKAERESMGEIEDAAYALAKTGRMMSNDVSTMKFYDDVAQKYAIDAKDADPAQLLEAGYKIMPTDKMPGTDIKKFGKLAGKAVPTRIHDDLTAFHKIKDSNLAPLMDAWKTVLGAWKVGKTALNPVVHVNNVMSNVMLYGMSGSKWSLLPKAAKDYVRKTGNYKLAEQYGVFDSTFVRGDLNLTPVEEKNFIDMLAPKHSFESNPVKYVAERIQASGKTAWRQTGSRMIDLYHQEDAVSRLAVFNDRLQKGMTPEDAAAEARKWLIDYDIDAAGVNILRQTALPFLAYTYRALPLLLEGATKHPSRLLPWIALGTIVNSVGSGRKPFEEDSDKVKEERRLMDPRLQGNFLGIPLAQRVGETPDGRGRYLDVTRWIPGGDLFDQHGMAHQLPGLPAPFTPTFGGPIDIAQSITRNQDPFTKDKIYNESDPLGSKIADWAKYTAGQYIPNNPVIPGSYSNEKLLQAYRGGESPLGDRLSMPMAIGQVMGVKVRPADLTKWRARKNLDYKQDVEELSKDLRGVISDLNRKLITQEEADAERQKIIDRMMTLQQQHMDVMYGDD